MDAASNNGVDYIRDIREKINFMPTRAKYRVYIIDEVHMLSSGAFNAFLKTLEEPPEHVKFILATTEPQKLLATILSRCQRFDFKKISNADLIKRMKIVCEEGNITATEGALNLIATLAEGGARDALSILERCLQDGDTTINEDKIKELVGIPKFVYVNNIIKSIIDRNIEASINAMNEVLDEGKDLSNFLWEMIKYVKDLLMYKVSKINEIYSEEEVKEIEELTKRVSKEELVNIIYKLSELENKMKWSSQKTIIFETEIIKLCVKEDTLGLEERVEKLEKAIKEGKIEVRTTASAPKAEPQNTRYESPSTYTQPKVEKNIVEEQKITKTEQAQKSQLSKGNIIKDWSNVLTDLKKQGKVMLYANLINTEAVEINDMTVGIRFKGGLNSFKQDVLKKPENMNVLTKEISIVCGKPMQIKFEDASSEGTSKTNTQTVNQSEVKHTQIEESEEDILGSLDIPINIIEE